MTTLPNPWMSAPALRPSQNTAEMQPKREPAGAGADTSFEPDFALLERCLLDWPVWSPAEDPPPLFIGAPSDDFIAACHRDLLPLLEDLARRA